MTPVEGLSPIAAHGSAAHAKTHAKTHGDASLSRKPTQCIGLGGWQLPAGNRMHTPVRPTPARLAPSRLPAGITALAPPPPRLRTHIAGCPDAEETVVFVHGWPDDARVWDPLLSCTEDDALARCRCVLIELPRADGQPWEGEDLSFARLAALVATAIQEEVPSRSVTLVGHDWGAFISAMVTRDHPELIKRLVMLDIGAQPAGPSLAGIGIVAYFLVNILIFMLGRISLLRSLADMLNALWIPLLCGRASPSFQRSTSRPTASAFNYFYAQAVPSLLLGGFGPLRESLWEPRVPLLFLHGTGIFHDAAWAARLQSLSPACDAVFVAKDHWLFQAEPARTRELLCAWLDVTDGLLREPSGDGESMPKERGAAGGERQWSSPGF